MRDLHPATVCLENQLAQAQAENERLRAERDSYQQTASVAEEKLEATQAIIDKLPRTADGVPITPGVVLSGRNGWIGVVRWIGEQEVIVERPDESTQQVVVGPCYSTRDAAEAAQENE